MGCIPGEAAKGVTLPGDLPETLGKAVRHGVELSGESADLTPRLYGAARGQVALAHPPRLIGQVDHRGGELSAHPESHAGSRGKRRQGGKCEDPGRRQEKLVLELGCPHECDLPPPVAEGKSLPKVRGEGLGLPVGVGAGFIGRGFMHLGTFPSGLLPWSRHDRTSCHAERTAPAGHGAAHH